MTYEHDVFSCLIGHYLFSKYTSSISSVYSMCAEVRDYNIVEAYYLYYTQ